MVSQVSNGLRFKTDLYSIHVDIQELQDKYGANWSKYSDA